MSLKISELYLSFGDLNVLNGLSLEITPGQTVGIIGPNGSGKTSLFNAISGFNKVKRGKILFNKTDITKLAPSSRAKLGLGRVFQNFGIFKEMTLEENLLVALENGVADSNGDLLKHTREHLALVNLGEKIKQKASSLSGGQMRLLEIARTIAFGATCFLLDEPTAGVSPVMKEQVIGLIRHLQSAGKTIVIIEHDINFIQGICDRVVVLDQGQVVLDGTPTEVRANPMLQEIYFGKQAANVR